MENPIVKVRTEVDISLASGGVATFYSFTGFARHAEHACLRFGDKNDKTPLVRLHSECLTGDIFGSLRCDCGNQLKEAIDVLSKEGGILLYLKQEGRGIGLYHKLEAYKLQDMGLDTFEANKKLNFPEDARSFECAAQMLKAIDVHRIRLLTNNPDKKNALEKFGIEVEDVINTGVFANAHNIFYLKAKAEKHHHAIKLDEILLANEK